MEERSWQTFTVKYQRVNISSIEVYMVSVGPDATTEMKKNGYDPIKLYL
jgi:hypothetical protein